MGELLGKPRQMDDRNRVTLPPKVIKLLDLKIGDDIFFKLNDGKITMGKALIKYEYIEDIIGDTKD